MARLHPEKSVGHLRQGAVGLAGSSGHAINSILNGEFIIIDFNYAEPHPAELAVQSGGSN